MLPSHDLDQLETLHGSAFGWALLCCDRDRERAADVLQTSYARILGGEARYAERSDLRSFLFGVVRRVAHEEQRSRRRARLRDVLAGRNASERDGAPGPGEALERSEVRDHVRASLKLLSTRQREVLHLRFYEGMTIEAAAAVLGIGVGSARRHYERAKSALRPHCEPHREPEWDTRCQPAAAPSAES